MKSLRRYGLIFGALLVAIAGFGVTAASADSGAFSSQSETILQGVPATGNQVTLAGSGLPASFSPSNGTVNLTFSEAGLEGYVDSATSTSLTMSIQVEPWVPAGAASVTVAGSDGSVATCTNCLSVTGDSAGWSFYPSASQEYIGNNDQVNVPVAICPAETVDGNLVDECEPENPPIGTTTTTLSVGTTAVAYIQLDGPSGVGDVESGDTISFYGAPGQFETSGSPLLGGSAIGVTAESDAASSLPLDPTLNAIVVRNPDGTVAICSNCIAVAPSSQSTSGTGSIGYSYDPSPIYQFGDQLLVGGTVTCTYPVAMFLHYRLQQGSTTATASRWVSCEDATYVSMAVPDAGFVPGSIGLGLSGGAYIPALSQFASNANGVTTAATYSPPLLIGVTLDSTGYRGPGEAIFGATVTCNEAVSGTASVAFTLDGATVDSSAAATCGSDGLGYVVFDVPGPWGAGPAGVTAAFSADGNTGTATAVVNIT